LKCYDVGKTSLQKFCAGNMGDREVYQFAIFNLHFGLGFYFWLLNASLRAAICAFVGKSE